MKENFIKYLFLFIFIMSFAEFIGAESNKIRILSTTSTRDSGLYSFILPKFEKKFNVKAHVLAVGTGQALQNAKNCYGDILIVHATHLEKKFIEEGYGVERNNLMYNDFVVVGPNNDPAHIYKTKNITNVLKKIINTSSIFISRGDNSGTHISETELWKLSNLDPSIYSGDWYMESGQGMGATLNIAIGMDAYSFTDRATWIRFKNKQNHKILFEGDPQLYNQYGIVKINPKHCKNRNHSLANNFYNWILSAEGQKLIGSFRIDGERVFIPNSPE